MPVVLALAPGTLSNRVAVDVGKAGQGCWDEPGHRLVSFHVCSSHLGGT